MRKNTNLRMLACMLARKLTRDTAVTSPLYQGDKHGAFSGNGTATGFAINLWCRGPSAVTSPLTGFQNQPQVFLCLPRGPGPGPGPLVLPWPLALAPGPLALAPSLALTFWALALACLGARYF